MLHGFCSHRAAALELHLYSIHPLFALLNISELGPGFPERPPLVRLGNILGHRWVDPQSLHITGHEGLRRWSPHSSLSRIVREIAEEFVANPPYPLNQPPPGPQQQPQPFFPPQAVQPSQPAANLLPVIQAPGRGGPVPAPQPAPDRMVDDFVMLPSSNGKPPGVSGAGSPASAASSSQQERDSEASSLAAAMAESEALAAAEAAKRKAAAAAALPDLPQIPESFPELDGLRYHELHRVVIYSIKST